MDINQVAGLSALQVEPLMPLIECKSKPSALDFFLYL